MGMSCPSSPVEVPGVVLAPSEMLAGERRVLVLLSKVIGLELTAFNPGEGLSIGRKCCRASGILSRSEKDIAAHC